MVNYNHRTYKFHWVKSNATQEKVLIPHSLYLHSLTLEPEEKDAFLFQLTKGKEWFTDESPLYDAIETGTLQCNGSFKCKVTRPNAKDSAYELQKIDCNCNNCGYLSRQLDTLNLAVEKDKILQQEMFDLTKQRKIEKVKNYITNLENNRSLIRNADDKIKTKKKYLTELEASYHTYQGDPNPQHYGKCLKFDKPITFLPNTFQLETQHCFVHRKDLAFQSASVTVD